MKTVIRKSVFETNSSSTHSLSLGKVTSNEVDNNASFEIRTKEAKIALLFGLIENAELECDERKKKYNTSREIVLKFKDAVIYEYCALTGYTKDQALLQIDYEEFSNTYLRDILKDEKTAKEKLKKYLEENEDFKDRFKRCKGVDIVEFAKDYFELDFMEFKAIARGKYRCDKYFENGCLNDCYCGFESYARISKQLDLANSNIQEKAKAFLNDDCKIIAKEYWNGFILEKTGEIY